MNEPKWVRQDAVLVVHDRQIKLFGGQYGLRDAGLLNSALARPKNFFFYENADITHLAAAYGFGICQNHPFIDGNKRTAFVVAVAFLKTNGYRFQAPQAEVIHTMENLAHGILSEEDFIYWIRNYSSPLSKR
ncbi:MAG: type II toxin-antitoxin system death-on-curing family toxin [Thermosynechococcaceae cyanobacterium]